MAGTVLGKRTRSTGQNAVSTSKSRRIVINDPNDENVNPFVTDPIKARQCDLIDNELASPRPKKTRTLPRAPVPKSSLSSGAVRSAKAGIQVLQEEKENDPTPRTPRHRDALQRKVSVTPRHRVLVAGTQRTPRSPVTPRTPSNAGTAVYAQARQLFSRCTAPGVLIGREQERSEITNFVSSRIDSTFGGCLYISGPPGTGKSALVNEVIEHHESLQKISVSVVNCMSIRNSKDLSAKLCEDLQLNEDSGFTYLKSRFLHNGKDESEHKYVVVLDEVDRLLELDVSLLYNLFEWSLAASTRLVLLGIANALDLTDRFLPRLKSRNLKPELLPFMPYTASQVAMVLTEKLRTLAPAGSSDLPFMQPPAIALCAKKVASQTGDLRRAFDICRRTIDLVEQETRARDMEASLQNSPSKTPLMENVNLSSPKRSPLKKPVNNENRAMTIYTIETAPKATIAHVSKVTSLVFGNGTMQRLGSLNIQQKAVLCALSSLEKRKRDRPIERRLLATPSKRETEAAPSIRELYESYSTLCKRDSLLSALSSLEFRDVVSGLETLGLLEAVNGDQSGGLMSPMTPTRTPSRKGRTAGFGMAAINVECKKVAGVISHKELASSLEGVNGGELLKEILHGDAF